jgi:transposase
LREALATGCFHHVTAREKEVVRRLRTVPGVEPVGASALVTVADARLFASGREFAA